jgi:hypothetical protein
MMKILVHAGGRIGILILGVLPISGCALSDALQSTVNQDWKFAQTIRGTAASPLHRKIFGDGPLDGKLYRDFFDRRVDRIEAEGFGFASCDGALACNGGDRIVHLSKSYGTLDVPPVIRLSFLIHEARHVDGYTHEICPAMREKSPYQNISLSGKRSCDDSALGAYGVQIVMLRNIAEYCDSCSSLTRSDARSYSAYLMTLILSDRARSLLFTDL